MNLGNVEWQSRKRLLLNPKIKMWVSPLQTVKLTEGLKPTSSLSDILESEVDEKYFLSQRLVDSLMSHAQRHREKGHGFGAKVHEIPPKPSGPVEAGRATPKTSSPTPSVSEEASQSET